VRFAPPQLAKTARPEAIPPGPPCGATLSHPATHVQHQPTSRGAARAVGQTWPLARDAGGTAGGVAPQGRLHCLSATQVAEHRQTASPARLYFLCDTLDPTPLLSHLSGRYVFGGRGTPVNAKSAPRHGECEGRGAAAPLHPASACDQRRLCLPVPPSLPPLPALLGRCTAIDDEFTAGDKRRLIGGKIQHAISDICGRAGSAEWETPQPFVP